MLRRKLTYQIHGSVWLCVSAVPLAWARSVRYRRNEKYQLMMGSVIRASEGPALGQ
jgi:hypothetical protein